MTDMPIPKVARWGAESDPQISPNPTSVGAVPAPVAVERRRHQRYKVSIKASIISPDEEPIPVVVVDVSTKGFGLDRTVPFAVNDRIAIEIPDVGIFDARVAWNSERRAGVELLRDFDIVSSESVEGLAAGLSCIAG